MSAKASSYAEITGSVDGLISHHVENDATVTAYLIARAALLQIRGIRGAGRAAEIAYRLADEFASEGVK